MDEIGLHPTADAPADDPVGERVDGESDVDEALPSPNYYK
jgi:hypothetical protein